MKSQFKQNRLLRALMTAPGKAVEATDRAPFISCLVLGLVMNILIYCLHARSPLRGLSMIVSEPLFFLFNGLILVTFYSLSLLFTRRIFFFALFSVAWLALGITDCVLLGMRDTPLEAIDFYIARTGLAIVHVYLGWLALILIIAAILVAIGLLVLLFIRCPKSRPDYVRCLLTVICCLLSLLLLTVAVVGLADADPRDYENIREAYDRYGFPYCFLRSVFERGIPKPESYSEQQIRDLVTALTKQPPTAPERTPNIIFVQLESFIDINRMKGLTFSENPIPNFTAMAEQGSHGHLSVPAIGSGTANTEFEVLSGLDLDFFGTGEYPYATILGDRCCETVAYTLSSLGYGTHSMHNHTGTFYDRYRVYANLGFDTFTPAEHMVGLTYTDLDWERDEILTDYILKALRSTDSSDFVFAVSVQGHGKYPEVPMVEKPVITLSGIDDEERHNAFQYYIHQLREMDLFIGELRDALLALEEDTVLVLYGDHLPSIGIAEHEIEGGDLLQSDYVIWSNLDLPVTESDIEAYQLSSLVLDKLGIEGGLVNKIHLEYYDDANYIEMLRLVGYDMLYGNRFAFGEHFPYTPTKLTLGLDPISITGISVPNDDGFFVSGQFFTPDSCVFANGRRLKTVYISGSTLFVENYTPEDGDSLTVVQISVDLQKLSQTAPYVVQAEELPTPAQKSSAP